MKIQQQIAPILSLAALTFGLVGCAPQAPRNSGRLPGTGSPEVTPVNGNTNMLVFPAREWPANLEKYMREHPAQRYVDSQVASSTGHGDPTSFVTIFEPRE